MRGADMKRFAVEDSYGDKLQIEITNKRLTIGAPDDELGKTPQSFWAFYDYESIKQIRDALNEVLEGMEASDEGDTGEPRQSG